MGLTCVLANSTGLTTQIIAFEPTHRYAAVWHENMIRNNVGNAVLFQCGISDRSAIAEFIVNPRAPLHNRFDLGDALRRYPSFEGDETRVESLLTLPLDELAGTMGIDSIALLKIDVEGAEPLVLRSASRLLERHAIKAMLIEFIPEFIVEMGNDPADLVKMLYRFEYEFHRIELSGDIGDTLSSAQVLAREFDGLNLAVLPA